MECGMELYSRPYRHIKASYFVTKITNNVCACRLAYRRYSYSIEYSIELHSLMSQYLQSRNVMCK